MRKLLTVFMCMLGVFTISCSSSSSAKYSEVLKKSLEEKYGEDFEIDSMEAIIDSNNNPTEKAWCHAVSGDFKGAIFLAEIDITTCEVSDNYLNLKVASEISGLLKSYYEESAKFYTVVESNSYYDKKSYDTIDEFLAEVDPYYITSYMVINSSLEVNDLSQSIYEFAQKLKALNYRDLGVVVFVIDKDNDFSEAFYSAEHKYEVFSEYDGTKMISGFQLRKGELLTSIEEIKAEFQKERR